MKHRKKLTLVLAGAMLLLTLAACGGDKTGVSSDPSAQLPSSPTGDISLTPVQSASAEELAKAVAQATQGRQLTQVVSQMEMELLMTVDKVSAPLTMTITMDMVQSQEPYTVYRAMESVAQSKDQSSTDLSQFYTRVEENLLVGYIHRDTEDLWSREELGQVPEAAPNGFAFLEAKASADLTLGEPVDLDGRQVYELTLPLAGAEVQQLLSGMGGMKDALVESGITTLTADELSAQAVIRVDGTTALPLGMELEIKGTEAAMDDLLVGLLGTADGTSVTALKVAYTGLSYDPVEVPQVPAEGVQFTTQASQEPEQDDGSYVIQESGSAVKLTPPAGWTVSDSSYNGVFLEETEGKGMASLILYADTDSQEFINYINQEDVAALKGQLLYVDQGDGPAVSGFNTMWVKGTEMNLYYAWKPVGDCWLFVQMVDYGGRSLEQAMTPMLEAVKDHTL